MKPIRLPQLQSRERLLAIGAGAVLLIVLLDRAVLDPWLKHGQTIRREIRQMEESLRSYDRLLMHKDRVLTGFARYERYFRPSIADDLQFAGLLKEIEGIVSDSGLVLHEIKPLPIETNEAVARYPLEVRFQCTLEQWVDFVYRIETSSSLYEIIRAGLSMKEETPDKLEGFLQVASTVRAANSEGGHVETGGAHAAGR